MIFQPMAPGRSSSFTVLAVPLLFLLNLQTPLEKPRTSIEFGLQSLDSLVCTFGPLGPGPNASPFMKCLRFSQGLCKGMGTPRWMASLKLIVRAQMNTLLLFVPCSQPPPPISLMSAQVTLLGALLGERQLGPVHGASTASSALQTRRHALR